MEPFDKNSSAAIGTIDNAGRLFHTALEFVRFVYVAPGAHNIDRLRQYIIMLEREFSGETI